jgi:hypothetical protein
VVLIFIGIGGPRRSGERVEQGHRRSSRLPLMAIVSALFWPTSTINRLPRVMPV